MVDSIFGASNMRRIGEEDEIDGKYDTTGEGVVYTNKLRHLWSKLQGTNNNMQGIEMGSI